MITIRQRKILCEKILRKMEFASSIVRNENSNIQ